jgi:hypothetical protein
MILLKNKKSIGLSIFLILFFFECKKQTVIKSPEDYYISSSGGIIKPGVGSGYEITIPANALLSGQYIKEKANTNIPKLILDSTFSFGPVSEVINFARYNCNSLLIPGTMKLSFANNYGAYYNLPQTKPYCINNNQNIRDFNNWEEITLFTSYVYNYNYILEFQFTDLNKTYFIGWSSN